MSTPQVNANVTDRNREQTEKICGLLKWGYLRDGETALIWPLNKDFDAANPDTQDQRLSKHCFTLDQVVGMLKNEGAYWVGAEDCSIGNWKHVHAHDLTAAMDALIKVLETKKGETT